MVVEESHVTELGLSGVIDMKCCEKAIDPELCGVTRFVHDSFLLPCE